MGIRGLGKLLIGVGGLLWAVTAGAATYTVTSLEDSGPGTLRQAILNANANAGADSIKFNILPAGTKTLSLLTPLPPLTDPVTIDGTSQPGAGGLPGIELEGSLAETSNMDGLRIRAANCIVRGLAITRMGNSGIVLEANANTALIEQCHIGVNAGGWMPLGCSVGLWVQDVLSATIRNNVISSNGVGIQFAGLADKSKVQNCLIGTDVSGSLALGNTIGIGIETGRENTIENCTIASSTDTGILLTGGATKNQLRNNRIGIGVFGDPLPNEGYGIRLLGCPANTIQGNFLASNFYGGIGLHGADTKTNRVESNIVFGSVVGVELAEGASSNIIGSTTGRNQIAGNLLAGVLVYNPGTANNIIEGNLIFNNAGYGLALFSSNTPVRTNSISGNGMDGVTIGAEDANTFATHVTLQNNAIYQNGDLGIRLESDGDQGGNNLQAAPRLARASIENGKTVLLGTLLATANTKYRVELFVSDDLDPSGLGEGQSVLAAFDITTNSTGSGSINTGSLNIPAVRRGQYLSATATDPNGNTSAFSNAVFAGEPNESPVLTALDPASIVRGSGAFTLTVTGSKFLNGAIILWNGQARSTTFVSSTSLKATIPASDLNSVGTVDITVANPPPGGGLSNPLLFTVRNPAPTLTSLTPDNAPVGSVGITLTLKGTNFVPGAVVHWNSTDYTPATLTTTQITVQIPSLEFVSAANVPVTVINPAPGGGTSGAVNFAIKNPVPTLTAIDPNAATANNPALTVNVTGSNFVPTSVMRWAGQDRTTTYLSPTQLQATIPNTDLTTPGTFNITVFNPGPGGGTSGSLPFTITGLPQFSLVETVATRSGSVTVTFKLKNVGTATATGLKITVGTLSGTPTTTTLPRTVADLAAGATSASLSLVFPGSVAAGNRVLSLTLTATGKSYSVAKLVTVP